MEVSCTFSREVTGGRVKMLLPFFLILFINVYQKKKQKNFVNTDKPCRKKARHVKKLSPVTQRDSNKDLSTKLLMNVSFVIFHKKMFLVRLSISEHRRRVLCNFCSNQLFSGNITKLQVLTFFGQICFKNSPCKCFC